MCSNQGILGVNRDGGFAERMAVPEDTITGRGVNAVPDDMDPSVATLTEPLACCVHGQHMALVSSGDRVAVFGSGPMGLMHTALASSKGAAVMVIEPDRKRRELSLRMGAERAVDPSEENVTAAVIDWSGGRGADVAMLSTPRVRVSDELMRAMAPRGRICAFSGLPKDDTTGPVDFNLLHYRELMLVGAYGCTSASDSEALGILASGKIDLRPLISRRMPLGSIEEAFRSIEERVALKCVIDDLTR